MSGLPMISLVNSHAARCCGVVSFSNSCFLWAITYLSQWALAGFLWVLVSPQDIEKINAEFLRNRGFDDG